MILYLTSVLLKIITFCIPLSKSTLNLPTTKCLYTVLNLAYLLVVINKSNDHTLTVLLV